MPVLRSPSSPALPRPRLAAAALAAALALCTTQPGAQPTEKVSDGVVKIGMLLDMSGVYADIVGPGAVIAANMAIADFGGKVLGKPIELVVADHQNKADLTAAKAREWFDNQKVDMLADVAATAPALAALEVAKQKNKIALFPSAASSRLSNENCSAVSVHWTYDTYALAAGTGRGVVRNGGDTWFFLTADYAFGTNLQNDTTEVIKAEGGKVLGAVRHPLNASDFSSFLLQAQSSKAKVVGLANAGGDMINSIKAANEFGITKNQKLAALLVFINDIHSIGLQTAQGMLLTEAFYWDANEETRKWSRRFFPQHKRMPNMAQAGIYSGITHYLKAVQAAGTDETTAVMAKMKAMPVNDFMTKNGKIREDGRLIRDMYVYEVKKPSESQYPWDYYKLKATIPADQAFLPLSRSVCPLVAKK
jgi:branched-chain amino acid transport system substrate-binding protein